MAEMKGEQMTLTCRHCRKSNPEAWFRDTAMLILTSALFGDERAEYRWPIVCDDCWQKFRERFPSTRTKQ